MIENLLASQSLVVLAGGGCVFFATFLLTKMLSKMYKIKKSAEDEIVVTEGTNATVQALLPMAHAVGNAIKVSLASDKNSFFSKLFVNTDKKLSAAGRPEGLTPVEYVGFYFISATCWALFVLLCVVMISPEATFTLQGLNYALLGAVFGCLYWRSWLNEKIRKRQREILLALPFSLDLLTLSMEAGLDFTSALSRIVSKMRHSPLGHEFSLMLHEIQLGKSRSDALRDFGARCDVQEVRTVVASLVQAEELGSSMGLVLRIQSAQQRERRSQRAEEKAMKAPVKMLFPMVIIVSAVLVIIVSPIIIQYMYTM